TVKGTKREAEAELACILGSIQSGSYVDPTKMSVGELLGKWREEVASVQVSAKTMERYGEHIDRLISGLGGIPLSRLQPLAIQAFYSGLRKSGHKRRDGGLSEQTLLHIHKVLTAALSQAVRWRLIASNPADDVNPPRPARVEMQTLDEREMCQLLGAAEGTALRVPTLLWLTTGLRRGELLGLMWRDLDRDSKRLSVVRSLEETRKGLLLKTPKTNLSTRVLTLPPVVLEALFRHELLQKQQRLAAGPAYQDNGLIFPDRNGRPQRPRNVTKAFAALVSRAKITPVSIHGLRHTHITELLRGGVHPKVVSERAGHASVAFTLQRYAHALPDMQQDAADHAERLVGNLMSK
ncbi:MAG: tyrosine-type recombinase/integrase, partial [Gammaproteobacteria bacterium]